MKIAALLCSLFFFVGLAKLFLLRFEAGNVYPMYSSLRSDPLGIRVLFDSLKRMPDAQVDRNFRPWRQVELDGKTTLMIIGISPSGGGLETETFDILLDRLYQSGGRLVVTFSPPPGSIRQPEAGKTSLPADTQPSEISDRSDEDDDVLPTFDDHLITETMGALDFWISVSNKRPPSGKADRVVDHPDVLPSQIVWRSPLYFELSNKAWQTLFAHQNKPVVVQRPWGKGTVVMASDSYLLSNEALRNHRSAQWLTWLLVPGRKIVFDEFHKGLVVKPGIAGLARQYRLHGVFAALLILTGLFVWRQAAVFMPTTLSESGSRQAFPAAGRDTRQGVVHLTRRHIRPEALLTVCFQAWKTQAAPNISSSLLKEVKALVKQSEADSREEVQIEIYQRICQLLKQGKTK